MTVRHNPKHYEKTGPNVNRLLNQMPHFRKIWAGRNLQIPNSLYGNSESLTIGLEVPVGRSGNDSPPCIEENNFMLKACLISPVRFVGVADSPNLLSFSLTIS